MKGEIITPTAPLDHVIQVNNDRLLAAIVVDF